MKLLYLISRDDDGDYDTYSDAVVVAMNSHEAKFIHPDGKSLWQKNPDPDDTENENCWVGKGHGFVDTFSWVDPSRVIVKFIGRAVDTLENNTVICASFHAG